jgi:hypothetical protein
MNHFDLLSASQDPTQDVNKANNAARNRKKKERRNQRKDVESISVDQTAAYPVLEVEPKQMQGRKSLKKTLSQVCKEFLRDASQMDCWQAWDGWVREVGAPARREEVVTSARSIGICFRVHCISRASIYITLGAKRISGHGRGAIQLDSRHKRHQCASRADIFSGDNYHLDLPSPMLCVRSRSTCDRQSAS